MPHRVGVLLPRPRRQHGRHILARLILGQPNLLPPTHRALRGQPPGRKPRRRTVPPLASQARHRRVGQDPGMQHTNPLHSEPPMPRRRSPTRNIPNASARIMMKTMATASQTRVRPTWQTAYAPMLNLSTSSPPEAPPNRTQQSLFPAVPAESRNTIAYPSSSPSSLAKHSLVASIASRVMFASTRRVTSRSPLSPKEEVGMQT